MSSASVRQKLSRSAPHTVQPAGNARFPVTALGCAGAVEHFNFPGSYQVMWFLGSVLVLPFAACGREPLMRIRRLAPSAQLKTAGGVCPGQPERTDRST